jgi:serine O-acetyltransferase
MDGIPTTWDDLRETLQADYARNETRGQRLTLLIFRLGQYATASSGRGAAILRLVWRFADRLYLRTLLGTELPPRFRCGPGLALPHAGRGVVVHENAIGAHSMIFHRLTIGTHGGPGAPRIGHDVLIGTGAVIVGGIRVGDYAEIGANAVVSRDVADWTAIGPAPPKSAERVEVAST